MRVISPLHIGNGNELTPVDFYPAKDRIYVLDVDKLISDLVKLGVEYDELLDFLKSPGESWYIWKHYLERYHLNPAHYSRYSLKIKGELGKRSSGIREFIKTNGKPYIPGSSIKGAIRTAVMYKVLRDCGDVNTVVEAIRWSGEIIKDKNKKNRTINKVISKLIEDIYYKSEDLLDYHLTILLRENVDPKSADDSLEAIVFGFEVSRGRIRHEPKRDPMRGLIVRDSKPISLDKLSLYEVKVHGNPQLIPIYVEALDPGTVVDIEIRVDRELLKRNANYMNGLFWYCLSLKGDPWDVFEEFIWEAVDDFYKELAKAEERKAREFYKELSSYERILRVGWGSGWISTTIGLLLKGRGNKWERVRRKLGLGKNPKTKNIVAKFPKTYRLTTNGMPMGWVAL
ncbi:type III-A CRISPR-associated RAMP protein Csm5 [Pyrococcus sp. ST04]|uniref:type III-A CRISPR-associated RAMP protein Csm5 n=1 Tax=Pyrococcus sp. ST04 TaxID=1183377 RepID=UPI000260591B|nr:type III-A CRISPR-associated RAMP protein Csm5 [Pyrococcus sp. ST04]AFK21708.1 putative CRISPR-associated RAMP protein, Csm5 family [Pyrococcus sp. ST04]